MTPTQFVVLGICASARKESRSRVLLDIALEGAAAAGAATDLLDLRTDPLPLYRPGAPGDEPTGAIRRRVIEATALIVASPEYHGSMSGVAKSFFDHHDDEISGKLVGLMAATGGSQGTSCLAHMRAVCLSCHAWTLPYGVAARGSDFGEDEALINEVVVARARGLGRDVAVYGPLLAARFRKDARSGSGLPEAGFAARHGNAPWLDQEPRPAPEP